MNSIEQIVDEFIKNGKSEEETSTYEIKSIEEALQYYHNHIVEKINSIDPTKSNNAIDHHIKIKSLLQDTNPKE